MKKTTTILMFLLLVVNFGLQAQTTETDDEFRQYVNWGLFAGPNITGYRMSTVGTEYAPNKTRAGLGLDAGVMLEYHVNRQWSLVFDAAGCIERVKLMKSDSIDLLATYGMDLAATTAYRIPQTHGALLLAAGPYTHFVFASTINGDGATPNPYTRIIATNPHTGKANFAMNDFNAGLMFSAGYEFENSLRVELNLKWGITDLLNYDSHDLYTKPYKLAVLIYYSFN